MPQRKIKILLDECVGHLPTSKKLLKTTNIKTFEDINLPFGISDEQVLSAGQRHRRLILTFDKKSGFSLSIIRKPDYKDTGVIIVPERYDEIEIDGVIYKLSKEVSQDDLTHARTEVTLDGATITSSEHEKVDIEFT